MFISRTPLRLSFFGGGSDYPEFYLRKKGAVLGTSIDKYTYVTINRGSPFFDHKIRLTYSQQETVKSIHEIVHPSVRETLKFVGIQDNLDIHIFADLPSKTGLGSSSSFTVGFLNACYGYQSIFATKSKLANDAIHIERNLIQEVVGAQDQIHAAFGGFNIIRFDSQGTTVVPVLVKPENKWLIQNSILLLYTGFTRYASDISKEQVEKTKNLSNDQYLERMIEQVDEAQDILSQYSGEKMLKKFGQLLHEGWELKKNLAGNITNSTLDHWYARAREAGAIGGKLAGAGSGGFLLLLVEEKNRASVKNALKELMEVKFRFESYGTTIIYANEPPSFLAMS